MRPSGTHGIGQSTTTGRNGGAGRTTLMRKVHARFLRHRAAATELTRGQKQEARTRKPAVIRHRMDRRDRSPTAGGESWQPSAPELRTRGQEKTLFDRCDCGRRCASVCALHELTRGSNTQTLLTAITEACRTTRALGSDFLPLTFHVLRKRAVGTANNIDGDAKRPRGSTLRQAQGSPRASPRRQRGREGQIASEPS
jgi:hypothetical protein